MALPSASGGDPAVGRAFAHDAYRQRLRWRPCDSPHAHHLPGLRLQKEVASLPRGEQESRLLPGRPMAVPPR
eukprot:4657604-Heterocapsa_arctica.AAC.1